MNENERKFSSTIVTIICGVALLSDGYINNSIGSVVTILKRLYPEETKSSVAFQNLASCAFIGVVFGQLTFGWLSDRYGRKTGMLLATSILIIFQIACAGAYASNTHGMLIALVIYRTFLGIGIGAEYPTGSVAAAESASETNKDHRHSIFIAVTNCAIDAGFILSAFVVYLLLLVFPDNLEIVWRLAIGAGAIIPCSILYFRLQIDDTKAYENSVSMSKKIPLYLIIKHYGSRLVVVSSVWFIYDFSSYAFSLYSSTITASVLPKDASLSTTFGWDTLILCFYLPGVLLGAPTSDRLGPKNTLIIGLVLQAFFGFILSGWYSVISAHIALFSVLYGVFVSMGELGPGNNIGLLASSSCSSIIRGRFYGISAAIGKIGAFVGTYLFPIMQNYYGNGDTIKGQSGPFMVASSLNVVAAIIAYFFLPAISKNCVDEEDEAFKAFLKAQGVLSEN